MIYIFIAAVVVYLARTLFMFVGAGKIRRKSIGQGEFEPSVCVLVPARNEEETIEQCLISLASSNYPKEKFEIIAIDDRSSDNTLSIMQKVAAKFDNIKVLSIKDEQQKQNLRGKAGALHFGAEVAKGEILLMTDADCIVHPEWIRTIAKNYEDEHIGLVASFTLVDGKRLFDIIQSVEWIYMNTMASAGVALNIPLGCYGNNLSVRRKVYEEIGGYKKIPFSVTEDLSLLKTVHNCGHSLHYVTDINGTVTTRPCKTFTEYISQHRRWAMGGLTLGWKAVVFVLSSLLMWIGIVASLFTANYIFAILLLLLRFMGDFSIIFPSAIKLKQNKLLKYIIPSILFFLIIELIIPFTLFSKKVHWKGQIFKG
ncbi:MAG: glycosyltransferase [Ignavibacteria bacterium]|nr:glycosyltransferase [Ignavibacteria bacterium]